jgi:hypothetical protein
MDDFNQFVVNGIIANNDFNITEVKDLVSMRSLDFNRNQYIEIVNLIKSGKFNQLNEIPNIDNDFEFLDILTFKDKSGRNFWVTVYSNNALENDPQVIDIFEISAHPDVNVPLVQ